MRCCVIGGGGFLGRYLCPLLLDAGHDVEVWGRKPVLSVRHDLTGLVYRSANGSDRQSLRDGLREFDAIIDLAYATVPRTSFNDPLYDLQANLPRVLEMLEDSRQCNDLKRIIIVSSGGAIYGPRSSAAITEDTLPMPISPYGVTKLTAERYALMYHHLYGTPAIVVRPGNAYGRWQRPFTTQGFIATAMGHIIRGEDVVVFGEHGTVRDYIHARDVASGIVAALDHGVSGETYNIGSGVGRSNLDILDLLRPLADAARLPVRVRHTEPRKFDVTANVLNSDRLSSCSGWYPKISMDEGLIDMWDEFTHAATQNSRACHVAT